MYYISKQAFLKIHLCKLQYFIILNMLRFLCKKIHVNNIKLILLQVNYIFFSSDIFPRKIAFSDFFKNYM